MKRILLIIPMMLVAGALWGQSNINGGGGSGTGSGTVSGQANNVIPKGTTATTITQQSSITDNGTTVSVTEPITTTGSVSTGSGCTPAGSTATGGLCGTEATSTGWTPTAGFDYMRADSTQHTFLCSLNGAAEVLCGGANFPLTVSGTVTSGGMPYFNSTTQESSSGIMNANILIKGGGAGAAPTNSSITDNGTTVSTSENLVTTGAVSTGTSPPTCTIGTAGAHCFGEGTAPTGAASVDALYGDATAHQLKMINNNGTADIVGDAIVQFCGATSGASQACVKTREINPFIIFGDVALNTATSQSITSLPFTAAADYSCTGSDLTTAAGVVTFNTYAAASVTIAETGGVNTDHLRYICIGF